MLGQATGLDQLGMAGMELGGMLGAQKASAANAAMGNLLQGYASGTDLLARQGQAQAGGMQGLGSSLGSWGASGRGGNYSNFGNTAFYAPQAAGVENTRYGNAASFANPEYSDVAGYY
jgi:hypothetical protein